jgi:phenylalanyl-tRNA synthetase beta chain
MKFSINWAQHYSNIDLKNWSADQVVSMIGSQLGAIEEVTAWGQRYDGIIVSKIVSVKQHDNADTLHVCLIDDGGVAQNVTRNESGYIQVVCGAPNVSEGLIVAWITPGAVVPSSLDSEPFELEVREIRGETSNGMLASPKELGISDDHEGILEINVAAVGEEHSKPGTPFKKLYGLDDLVIDCENKMFTHRPDCFGILGIARELAGISGQQFVSPDWYLNPSDVLCTSNLPMSSKNEIAKAVPRFMVQVVEEVTVQPSSVGVQATLTRVGIRPINNIVDLTNFYMQLTAQPTHAFDYDKVKKLCTGDVTLFPRMAKKGETLELLNGQVITLSDKDIVIATDQQPIALAGIMGGSETEVDDTTKNVIIECATFDMYTIRRSSMRHGLFTDAVARFNKGQSPRQNAAVLARLVQNITEFAGGSAGYLFDSYSNESGMYWDSVSCDIDFINQRLGSSLTAAQVKEMLENVEFKVDFVEGALQVSAPFWRRDIELPEDIVEEVGRLYGFDKLPVSLPKRIATPTVINPLISFKSNIRSILAQAGATEVLSYSFVAGSLLSDAGQDTQEAFQLSNALSPALEYYRLSITPSLLSKVYQNIRSGHEMFSLFEIGKTHMKSNGVTGENVPHELEMLSFVYVMADKLATKSTGATYYEAKYYLDYLAQRLNISLEYTPVSNAEGHQIHGPFNKNRSALITESTSGAAIGVIGEYAYATRKKLKLPNHCAGFEINVAALLTVIGPDSQYVQQSRYPHIKQDMTITTKENVLYADVIKQVDMVLVNATKKEGYVCSIEPLDIYQKENSHSKQITLRVDIYHPDRTLTTQEVSELITYVIQETEQELAT